MEVSNIYTKECSCISFENIDLNIGYNNYRKFFCLEHMDKLKCCHNLDKLLLHVPLLQNLFEKIDLPFVIQPLYTNYNHDEMLMIFSILSTFYFLFIRKKNKNNYIIMFV